MTDNHPITPPDELVEKWSPSIAIDQATVKNFKVLATQAARWGADQELEACCEWMVKNFWLEPQGKSITNLRAARRPKPPSLKEQAQRILVENGTTLDGRMELDLDDIAIIRRALESLPDNQ